MSDDRPRITDLLRHLDLRDGAQAEELLSLVYDEFRVLAASQMRQERPGHTLAHQYEAVGANEIAAAWREREAAGQQ